MISELTTSVSVFQIKATDAVCVTDQCFRDLYPVVCCSRHFHRSFYTVCGNEEGKKGLCSQALHIVCKSCDFAEVFLIVTGNRR